MSKFTQELIDFSSRCTAIHGAEIEKWALDPNPIVSQVCKAILEASHEGGKRDE